MPAKGGSVEEKAPAWGIEPVPERLRVLGALDTGLLWGSLGVSLLVLVAGTFLVPALSLPTALLAIAVGGLLGNAMLAAAAAIGADARVPGMVLLRAPLGRRGSYLPTGLNVVQNLGWATFELIVIATAASALADRVLGFGGKPVWTLLFGLVTTLFALAGPISFVRRWVRRFAFWAVLVSLVYLTVWAVDRVDLGALWNRPAEGGLSFWQAVDVMVAMPVSWLPLAADYTRFARGRGPAFVGTGIGYLIPSVWLFALGAILLIPDPVDVMTTIAAGGAASAVALLALTVDETDEPFANVYSTAVSLQNVLPGVPQRALIVAAGALATGGALTIGLGHYLGFLYLLGSFFVPLFGVLLADWALARGHYEPADIFRAPALRIEQVGAWLAGFALYQWLQPVGPSWWTDLVAHAAPPELEIGATLPSFAVSFALGATLGLVARRVRAASVPA